MKKNDYDHRIHLKREYIKAKIAGNKSRSEEIFRLLNAPDPLAADFDPNGNSILRILVKKDGKLFAGSHAYDSVKQAVEAGSPDVNLVVVNLYQRNK